MALPAEEILGVRLKALSIEEEVRSQNPEYRRKAIKIDFI